MATLKGRSLLTLKDFSKEEILGLVALADRLKSEKRQGIYKKRLANKNIALIFEKPSTRTRCAFVTACFDEGAHPEYLGKNDIQLGHKESVEDTARVLGRLFDGIEFRGFAQQNVETLARYSGVPVWNGLTDEDHPTQVLADLMTIKERFGRIAGLRLCYIGDGRNNMANALMIGAAKTGLNMTVCAPKALFPEAGLTALCRSYAAETGCDLTVTESPAEAVAAADIVYTDVWCSMGEEAKASERVALLTPYQVNAELLTQALPHTIVMHCLPAVKGNEVTAAVFEQHADVIFDEAENRMHTIKAVMVATLTDAL